MSGYLPTGTSQVTSLWSILRDINYVTSLSCNDQLCPSDPFQGQLFCSEKGIKEPFLSNYSTGLTGQMQ